MDTDWLKDHPIELNLIVPIKRTMTLNWIAERLNT